MTTTETKYMKFVLVENKPKTKVYHVINKHWGDLLGIISWYSSWRQYVFEMEYDCVFNHTCLKEISNFLSELNKEHKEKQNQGI